MDIQFNCPKCSQEMNVNDTAVGLQVECPTCKGQITVPSGTQARAQSSQTVTSIPPSAPSPPPLAASPSARSNPPGFAPAVNPGPAITRRSGWADFLTAIGVLGLIVGFVVGILIVMGAEGSDLWVVFVVGVAGGLQAMFLAFLVNVFTDIRWFLKQLVDKR